MKKQLLLILMTLLPAYVNAEAPGITDYQDFVNNLAVLEDYAAAYAAENPGKDPAELTLKYIRAGVEGYTSAFWTAQAGGEDAKFADFVGSK